MFAGTARQQFVELRARPTFSGGLMMRWLTSPDRGVLTLVAVLCVAAATPLVAQQDSVPAPQAGTSAAQASSASASSASASSTSASSASASSALAGPRLRPEWQPVEPSFAGSRTARSMAAASDSHTITVTTLVLVLVVIIAVLLLVK
jgi:cobalamin biosynthesis Mg chelatase CobN